MNQISHIEDGASNALGVSWTLGLTSNNLAIIRRNTFTGLTSLISLRLGGNKIETIEKEVFADLGSLTHLDLGYNKLKTFRRDNKM